MMQDGISKFTVYKQVIEFLSMFCDNVSYNTQRMAKDCANYFSGKEGGIPSYNDVYTQQSERNPSNLYFKNNMDLNARQPKNNLYQVNQAPSYEVLQAKNNKQNQQLKVILRNRQISEILSTIIAFSQRIESIKQKLAGYPAESFSPVQFFNVLDLTQKGYVDIYDVKRFVNNENIGEKDIMALFKKVNGDHAKDSTRLTYFGYLNLIKPYFNQQLARDLLLRDSGTVKKHKKSQNIDENMLKNDMVQATQESVLLLFQQLMLLHCICTSEHEQNKEQLMKQFMLNMVEIKQLIGLNSLQDLGTMKSPFISKNPSSASMNNHKSPLWLFYEFIQNNSQFEIDFKNMKYLLSFLNAHQFSLINDKYLTLLFIPCNLKEQFVKHIKEKGEEFNDAYGGVTKYMNKYLTKQNLTNKGNIQPIKEYLQYRDYSTDMRQNQIDPISNNTNKMNFLEFVHPKSIQRMTNNHPRYQQPPHQQQVLYSQKELVNNKNFSQHPSIVVNASKQYLSKNQLIKMDPSQNPTYRQYSNSSSVPQQNVRINRPPQPVRKPQYPSHGQLNNEFYEQSQSKNQIINASQISQTPFLQQFMKKNNQVSNYNKNGVHIKVTRQNQNYSKVDSSGISDSAFQVIDYGYQAADQSKLSKKPQNKKYADESQKIKKQSLDSRYNMVISQYKNSNLHTQQAKKQLMNQHHLKPKFQQSYKPINSGTKNPVLNYSKENYIDSVGLSQSNMVNQSNFMNRFYEKGGNILNEFLKK